MNKKITKALVLMLSICLMAAVLVSCSASKNESNSSYDSAYAGKPGDIGDYKDEGLGGELTDGSLPTLEGDYQRKIIKTADISAETKDFDGAIACVETLCSSVGGYIESSNIRGNSYGGGREYRRASYTVRIPAEKLDSFSEGLDNLLNVTSSSSNAQEVTAAYYDIKSRIEVLELQKASLQELYDQYTDYGNIDYLMQLQDRLFDVIAEIESYQTRIKLYDDQVAYSTVSLHITEVVDYTESEEGSFLARLGDSFKDGLAFFGEIVSGLSIAIVFLLPLLCVAAVTVTAVLLATKKKRKEKKQKKEEEKQKS